MTAERAMTNSILHVVGARSVIQVADLIVGSAAVLMKDMQAIWSRSNKSGCDQNTNLPAHNLSVFGQKDRPIIIAIDYRRQETATPLPQPFDASNHLVKVTVEGANLTIRTDLVPTFETDDRKPCHEGVHTT